MKDEPEYAKNTMQYNGTVVDTLVKFGKDGKKVDEVINDRQYDAYQHWRMMYRRGFVTLETLDEILRLDGLRRFENPGDLIMTDDVQYAKTLEWEKKWYAALSNSTASEMLKQAGE